MNLKAIIENESHLETLLVFIRTVLIWLVLIINNSTFAFCKFKCFE